MVRILSFCTISFDIVIGIHHFNMIIFMVYYNYKIWNYLKKIENRVRIDIDCYNWQKKPLYY
jgi:energy-converting hydrogenase Eha subunit H